MFDKNKKIPLMSKMLKATKQEMDKPAFPKMGYRQGDMNKAPISQGTQKSC